MKGAIISSIVNLHKPFKVERDANAKVVGAISIKDNYPIAYKSKRLSCAQQNYLAYERELFAIIYALPKWRHYLYGVQFEIVFHHENVKWFMNQTDLKGQKARWAEILQEYDCKLQYCKGCYSIVADALSHMPKINSLLSQSWKANC